MRPASRQYKLYSPHVMTGRVFTRLKTLVLTKMLVGDRVLDVSGWLDKPECVPEPEVVKRYFVGISVCPQNKPVDV